MNASQEAAAWAAYEEDRDWFAGLGGYDDGEPLEAPGPADLARCQAAAAAYRAQKLALCQGAERWAAGN